MYCCLKVIASPVTKFIVSSHCFINLSYLAYEIFQCLIMVGGGGEFILTLLNTNNQIASGGDRCQNVVYGRVHGGIPVRSWVSVQRFM